MPAITLPCHARGSLGDQGCAVAQGSTQLAQANDGISGVGLTHLRNEILTLLEHGHDTFPQSAFEKSLTVFGDHLLLLSQRHTRHADNDGLGCGSQGVHQFLHVDGLGRSGSQSDDVGQLLSQITVSIESIETDELKSEAFVFLHDNGSGPRLSGSALTGNEHHLRDNAVASVCWKMDILAQNHTIGKVDDSISHGEC